MASARKSKPKLVNFRWNSESNILWLVNYVCNGAIVPVTLSNWLYHSPDWLHKYSRCNSPCTIWPLQSAWLCKITSLLNCTTSRVHALHNDYLFCFIIHNHILMCIDVNLNSVSNAIKSVLHQHVKSRMSSIKGQYIKLPIFLGGIFYVMTSSSKKTLKHSTYYSHWGCLFWNRWVWFEKKLYSFIGVKTARKVK